MHVLLLTMCVLFGSVSCATMFVHANDRIFVRSDDKRAKLYLNDRYILVTKTFP